MGKASLGGAGWREGDESPVPALTSSTPGFCPQLSWPLAEPSVNEAPTHKQGSLGVSSLPVLGFQKPWHQPASGQQEVEPGQVMLEARSLASHQGIPKNASIKKSSFVL